MKAGGFGVGVFGHGTADELGLGYARRMHLIKSHMIIVQSLFLLFLCSRTLGFDLARP